MAKGFFDPAPPPEEGASKRSLASQFAWFVGLAMASGIVVAIVAYVLRGLLFIG